MGVCVTDKSIGMNAKLKRLKRRYEYAKKEYEDALKDYESSEELRLAAIHEPKVNLLNIMHWSAYMQGARKAFLYVMEHDKDYDNKVYRDAVFKLITSDLRYMGMFLIENHTICFRNHKRDKKGKLVSCEAYFAEKITLYREV